MNYAEDVLNESLDQLQGIYDYLDEEKVAAIKKLNKLNLEIEEIANKIYSLSKTLDSIKK